MGSSEAKPRVNPIGILMILATVAWIVAMPTIGAIWFILAIDNKPDAAKGSVFENETGYWYGDGSFKSKQQIAAAEQLRTAGVTGGAVMVGLLCPIIPYVICMILLTVMAFAAKRT